jgi:hypothetical protein
MQHDATRFPTQKTQRTMLGPVADEPVRLTREDTENEQSHTTVQIKTIRQIIDENVPALKECTVDFLQVYRLLQKKFSEENPGAPMPPFDAFSDEWGLAILRNPGICNYLTLR